MSRIHDLGGREGFGPVDVKESEEPFHSDWEARTYGVIRAMTRAPDWTIDWFRHVRELIEPGDYLTRPYYDQWIQTYAAMLVNSGLATVEEISSGKASDAKHGLPPPMTNAFVREVGRFQSMNAERDADTSPRFSPGDKIVTLSEELPGHTRLPAYLRGKRGVIDSYRGTHVLPDANARGEERVEHLYTVGFAAADLWPEAKGSKDRNYADLWESYFERD